MGRLSGQREDAFTSANEAAGWQAPRVAVGYGEEIAGGGELPNQIARLVSRALKDARKHRELSRSDIARALTIELGRNVSEGTLEQWASEASISHRIPLDAFIALVAATGEHDLLGFIPGLFGFAVVPRRYMAVIELQLIEEHERELAAHKERLLVELGGARHGR